MASELAETMGIGWARSSSKKGFCSLLASWDITLPLELGVREGFTKKKLLFFFNLFKLPPPPSIKRLFIVYLSDILNDSPPLMDFLAKKISRIGGYPLPPLNGKNLLSSIFRAPLRRRKSRGILTVPE